MQENSRLLSLLLPCFNSAQRLHPACEAIAAQLDAAQIPFELLIMDDGSGDNSWEIARELARRDPRIRAFRMARNVTPPYRKCGFRRAAGCRFRCSACWRYRCWCTPAFSPTAGCSPGWTTIVALVAFFNGLVLFCLGVVAEYIWRIYEEVKGRPGFIIRKEEGNNGGNA